MFIVLAKSRIKGLRIRKERCGSPYKLNMLPGWSNTQQANAFESSPNCKVMVLEVILVDETSSSASSA